MPCLSHAWLTLLVIAALAETAVAQSPKTYSLADLKALEGTKSWGELLDHAEDVAPSQRNKSWNALVVKAANAVLAEDGEQYASMTLAESLRKRYPALMDDARFKQKRRDVGKAGLSQCYAGTHTGDECNITAIGFVKGSPGDEGLALDVAKLVTRNQNVYNAAPFMLLAVSGKDSSKACADIDLSRVVLAGLGLPKSHPSLAPSLSIAKKCWSELSETIEGEFDLKDSSYLVTNSCALLLAQKALIGKRASKCKKG